MRIPRWLWPLRFPRSVSIRSGGRCVEYVRLPDHGGGRITVHVLGDGPIRGTIDISGLAAALQADNKRIIIEHQDWLGPLSGSGGGHDGGFYSGGGGGPA